MADRYNITPLVDAAGGSGHRVRLFYSDDDPDGEEDEDEEKTKALNAIAAVFGGLMTSSFRQTGRRISDITFRKQPAHPSAAGDRERLQLDIAALRKQYAKLRERQRQAHVMFWTAGAAPSAPSNPSPVASLLAGRKPLLARRSSSSAAPGAPRLRLPPTRVAPPQQEAPSASTVRPFAWQRVPGVGLPLDRVLEQFIAATVDRSPRGRLIRRPVGRTRIESPSAVRSMCRPLMSRSSSRTGRA